MKAPMKCLACDQNLPYTHSSSASASPEHRALHHHHTCSSHDQSPDRPLYSYWDSPGRELFATSGAASRRRKQRQQQQLSLFSARASGSPLPQNNWFDARSSRAFVNLDDGRNRIPLRRAVLSDHVVYGPAITPNAFKRRSGLHRFEIECVVRGDVSWRSPVAHVLSFACLPRSPQRTARPKTALSPDSRRASGGEIITRSASSTVRTSLSLSSSDSESIIPLTVARLLCAAQVVIRPFAEQTQDDKRARKH